MELFPKKLGADEVRRVVEAFEAKFPRSPLGSKQLRDREWKRVPGNSGLLRLCGLLYDEIPQRNVPLQSLGKRALQGFLEVHAVSMALCGGAHLHTLREFL